MSEPRWSCSSWLSSAVAAFLVQESRADAAAAKLKAMIRVTATVLRDGQSKEVPLGQLVPGDIVKLAAGDMIPADLRLITCKDLFLTQSSLTGEAFPVEKFDAPESDPARAPLELKNVCFLGTSVESGTALGVIVATGLSTYLGSMSSAMVEQNNETSFDRGINSFTWLMIRFIFVMVPLVFLINGIAKGDWKDAFFFALAVAVGLTPEMLPMIVTVCLSKGALAMSRRKVIIKRLNSIQNLGAMDVLCTDKTGTLTMDHIILVKHCDVVLESDDSVLALAYLNSHFQTGLKNLLDRAVLQHARETAVQTTEQYNKVDEIPFDFSRKMMSVVVQAPGQPKRIICKGASEAIFKRCTRYELDGKIYPMERVILDDLRVEHDDLSTDGFRVLALAYKDLDDKGCYAKDDECDLILKGYVAFLDPPKDTSKAAIRALQDHGITVKVLTVDNELVSQKICAEVGLAIEHVLLGNQVEKLTDAELAESAGRTSLFAPLADCTSSGSSRPCKPRGMWSAFSATASTTRRRCAPPTSASRWTPPWTLPRSRPMPSSWRRACWSWRKEWWRGARSLRTSSNTSAWGPAPISATCLASWAPACFCPTCPWRRSRF